MSKFIRAANCHFQHLLVGKSEEVGDGYNRLHDNFPYSLCNGEFKGVFLHIPEQPSDGLIVIEPLDNGEDVILQGHDGSMCDLLREVPGLALSHSEQSLALLENHLQGPSLGVNPVGFEEVKPGVRGDDPAPCAVLGAPYEEHPAADAGEGDVRRDVPAPQLPAVLLRPFLVKVLDEGGCREVLPSKTVLGLSFLADLDAPEIMAFDVAGVDETYDFLAGEPAVGKQVLEADATLDGGPHHVHRKRDLVLVVLGEALANGIVLVALRCVSGVKLLLRHPVVLLAAFLPNEGEVKQHLGNAVRDAEEESLETEDAPVLEMGMDTPDTLHPLAGLGEVGVVNHQAGRPLLVVRPDFHTGPKLDVDMVHELAPVDAHITKETIEHVLFAAHQAA